MKRKELKNEALRYVERDGKSVLSAFCIGCGKLIADETIKPRHTFIRAKYCPECRKRIGKVQNAARQREWQQKHREQFAEATIYMKLYFKKFGA